MDILSILGFIIAILALGVGWILEGGDLVTLINIPALAIVLGGSFGAVLIQTPLKTLKRTFSIITWVYKPPKYIMKDCFNKIIRWSQLVRRDGLLSLEDNIELERDPFIRKGLELLVDGVEPESIRKTLELELEIREQQDTLAIRAIESMGGYCPTIGILGAVMGLIHVMGNLTDPSKLGVGIAVAFIATIYGVGFANLLFLPLSRKLTAIVQKRSSYKEMFIEGITAISSGENPYMIKVKLQGYTSV